MDLSLQDIEQLQDVKPYTPSEIQTLPKFEKILDTSVKLILPMEIPQEFNLLYIGDNNIKNIDALENIK